MSDNLPVIASVLRAIEERLTALYELQVDPSGRVQQAQHDILRIYGDTAQLREVFSLMRDQQMAAADALGILVGRVIEMDRRQTAQHGAMLAMIEALAHGVGQAAIAEAAEQARRILQAAEEDRLAELALAADQAKELLTIARTDAQSLISQALNRAEKHE